MSDNAKVILKGSTLRVALLISNVIIGLFMMPFLLRALGDDLYGTWILVGAVISFYGLIDLGMGNAMQRFLIRSIQGGDIHETKVALATSFIFAAAIGFVILLITVFVLFFAPMFLTDDVDHNLFRVTFALVALKAGVQFPLYTYYGIPIARYRYDVISVIQIFSLVVRTPLIVLFVNAGYGIVSIAVVTLITELAGSLLVIRYARSVLPEATLSLTYFRLSELRRYFHFAKWNYVNQVTHQIRFSIDEFVIGVTIGVGAVTHYAIASALISYFGSLMESAFGVFEPVFHKYHKKREWENLREAFLTTTEITIYASVLLGSLIFMLGESFINIWVGAEYADSVIVLLILGGSTVFYKAILPCEKILYAIAKQKFYAIASSIEALVNLTLSIILAKSIGIYGVALGTLIPSVITSVIVLPIYTAKQLSVPVSIFYSILSKGLALALALFGPTYYFLKLQELENFFVMLAAGSVVSLIYIVLCLRYLLRESTVSIVAKSLPEHVSRYVVRPDI